MTWVQAIQDVIDNPPKVRGPYKISHNNNNRKIA